jgi:hypothetical protein
LFRPRFLLSSACWMLASIETYIHICSAISNAPMFQAACQGSDTLQRTHSRLYKQANIYGSRIRTSGLQVMRAKPGIYNKKNTSFNVLLIKSSGAWIRTWDLHSLLRRKSGSYRHIWQSYKTNTLNLPYQLTHDRLERSTNIRNKFYHPSWCIRSAYGMHARETIFPPARNDLDPSNPRPSGLALQGV